MGSVEQTIYEPAIVPHPGEVVMEYLEFHGWSQRDLSRRTGLTPKTISEICNGKAPITPVTSLALEKALQRPAHLWLNLQRQFDEAEARRREAERSEAASWRDWAKKFPLKEMRRLGYIPPENSRKSDVNTLLTFLGVSSPDSWNAVWNAADVSYRQTRAFKTSVEAISVWVRETEISAEKIETATFDEQLLRSSIKTLRRYTRESADSIMEPVQALCAAAGVAVVWVPELSETGISGCARWLSEKKALIALTLRHKTDDQMWFTFFHEVGHLLLHRRRQLFILDNAEKDLSDGVVDQKMQQYEEEANRFSADTLIPPEAFADFVSNQVFDNESLYNFAERIGVGPGIVVGRLQHDKLLQPFQGNKLKQRLNWRISTED